MLPSIPGAFLTNDILVATSTRLDNSSLEGKLPSKDAASDHFTIWESTSRALAALDFNGGNLGKAALQARDLGM